MKIALVADHLGPLPAATDSYPGDPAARVLSLAAALAGHGQQVTVYVQTDTAAAARTARAVTVEPLPGQMPGGELSEATPLAYVGDVAGYLADRWHRSAPDVVHAHFWTSGMAALAAARGLAIPVVATFHSLASQTRRTRPAPSGAAARAQLEPAIARSVTAVLADTSDERSEVGRLGLPQAAVRVVPPGVDTIRFAPSGPAAERGQRARLLMVWAPGEATAQALRALAEVPGAELVIAGADRRSPLWPTTLNTVPLRTSPGDSASRAAASAAGNSARPTSRR